MRQAWAVLLVVLAGCLPTLRGVEPERPPSADNWGPNPAPLEWWYVSGYLPHEGLAFHWAMFKAFSPQDYRLGGLPAAVLFPGPFHASHLVVTDLRSGTKVFDERFDFAFDRPRGDSVTSYPPLRLEQGDWSLVGEGGGYRLSAGPLQLTLTPRKPAVVHPPGYSGTAETGRMYYVSYTRLGLEGTISGRRVAGEAWMDHQWGDQIGGEGLGARWDWFGLHLSGGEDLMLYRVRDAAGRVVQTFGTRVSREGRASEVKNLRMTPLESWTSRTGRTYSLSWGLEADGLSLRLDPLRREQELLSASTRVAYWEGAVAGTGTLDGQPIQAWGMGEFVAGGYMPPGQ